MIINVRLSATNVHITLNLLEKDTIFVRKNQECYRSTPNNDYHIVQSQLFKMHFKNTLSFSFLLVVFLTGLSSQKPLDVKQYLYDYDYLDSTENVDSSQLHEAVSKFQKSVGLPQTGILDKETLRIMHLPRCGRPKNIPRVIQSSAPFVWRKNHLTYAIGDTAGVISRNNMRKIFQNVVQLWTKNTNLVLTESSYQPDIRLKFQNFEEPQTLGYGFYPEHGGIILRRAANFWTQNFQDASKYFLPQTTAHELGHALGLRHSPSTSSIMYPVYIRDTPEPSMIDVNNLIALYGGKAVLNNSVICRDMTVDAMVIVNNQNIVIKDELYWTFNEGGLTGGPFSLHELFTGFSDKVDAAFTYKDKVYLFSKHVFYRYVRRFLKKKLIGAGFDRLPSDINAAFYQPSENAAHFFKGSRYYKFDTTKAAGKRLIVNGKQISQYWPGIPNFLEAATILEGNKAFFIEKAKCYTFDLNSKTISRIQDCQTEFYKC